MRIYFLLKLFFFWYFLTGCTTPIKQETTLRDLDVQPSETGKPAIFVKPTSDEEIRQAYDDYLRTAGSDEKGRRVAMGRLAELEMEKLKRLEGEKKDPQRSFTDALQTESLEKTIALHNKTLEEYPDATDNDQILYMLAQNHEKLGRTDESLNALRRLTEQYPQSLHYPEAQFRIGEFVFITGDYLSAEIAYSDVIYSGGNHPLYEQALIKRAWSRYKQGLHNEATEDFAIAIKHRKFSDYKNLSTKDRDDFNEYFRSLALTAKNLSSLEVLNDYFFEPHQRQYIYQTYFAISNLLVIEKQFSQAVHVMDEFIRNHPDAVEKPDALLQKIHALRVSDQRDQYSTEMESFYKTYNADSNFWDMNSVSSNRQKIKESMRNNILLIADTEQIEYRKSKKMANFDNAEKWYKRYLAHYSAYARQDKVYSVYGDLLNSQNRKIEALSLFEKAAYDGEILLEKDAAYATIVITDKLFQADPKNTQWLEKHLVYAALSARMYTNEERYQKVSLHAIELAYNNQRYREVIDLSNSLASNLPQAKQIDVNYIKAMALLKLNSASEAEIIFAELVKEATSPELRNKFREALAVCLYQQGKAALSVDSEITVKYFVKIAQQLPETSIAADALYEAIQILISKEFWPEAATAIELFENLYASHELRKDVTRQLSSVYLNLGQGDRAALVFEKISSQDSDKSVQMSSLWKAAELYESKNRFDDAIRAYINYAENYTSPFPQYLESMNRLVNIYSKIRDFKSAEIWRERIIAADKKSLPSLKNDRTNLIAAQAHIEQAKIMKGKFFDVKLKEPLAQQLRLKKKFMQDAINLYGQASSYRIAEITTESTFGIGEIYQSFSKSLLDSERPINLSADELEQYNILIEDQAFPFEEKSIEFHEINIARSADSIDNKWIRESLGALRNLFPSRYARKGKADIFRDGVN